MDKILLGTSKPWKKFLKRDKMVTFCQSYINGFYYVMNAL